MNDDRSVLPLGRPPSQEGWRSGVRRQFPRLVGAIDRVGDPLVAWSKQRLSDEAFISRQFQEHIGFALDLNDPKLLVEKIQWLKLHDLTPLHRICSDKLSVRDHVAKTVGSDLLVPLFDVLDDARAFTPERIAQASFAAKTNHDCGGVVLCSDRDLFDWPGARAKLHRHLKVDYWRKQREKAYRGIIRKIVVEELLRGPSGGSPDDLKFFCFSGRVEFVQVVSGRRQAMTRTMLSPAWDVLPIRRRGIPSASAPPLRPKRLDDLLAVAEALAAPFRFCRVDLYEVGETIRFGEYCFYPDGGYRPFEPLEWERRLGDLIRL